MLNRRRVDNSMHNLTQAVWNEMHLIEMKGRYTKLATLGIYFIQLCYGIVEI